MNLAWEECEFTIISYSATGCYLQQSRTLACYFKIKKNLKERKEAPLVLSSYNGPSAYSNVTVLPDGNIGCLFEAGYAKPYEGIVFEAITLQEFTKR
mgnify:CR=1 FL=1